MPYDASTDTPTPSPDSASRPAPVPACRVTTLGDGIVEALARGDRVELRIDGAEARLVMPADPGEDASNGEGSDEALRVRCVSVDTGGRGGSDAERSDPGAEVASMRRRLREARVVSLVAVLALFGLLFGFASHQSRVLAQQDTLRRAQAEAQERALDGIVRQLRNEQRMAIASGLEIEAERTRHEVERLSESVRLENERLLESRLVDLEIAHDSGDDPRIARLASEVRGLRDEVARNAPPSRVFQHILEANDASVVLIYTSFDYVVDAPSGPVRRNSTGWGTGFFVSEEGHILTNKHVVQPWKFDPKYASLAAMGVAHVDPESLLVCAWPGGTTAIGADGEPDLARGFNNGPLGNLELLRTAPDDMERTSVSTPSGAKVLAPMHRMSNADLAILRVSTVTPSKPVHMASVTGPTEIEKLDPIMVIGFPRGRGILETRLAETSPSMGTVRKVEDTIYVTASIIPGNSGGPVFTSDGEVIGIATRVYSETLGACIRIEHALALLEE